MVLHLANSKTMGMGWSWVCDKQAARMYTTTTSTYIIVDDYIYTTMGLSFQETVNTIRTYVRSPRLRRIYTTAAQALCVLM